MIAVAREALRTLGQVLAYPLRSRSYGLFLFLLLGLVLVAVVALGTFAAPVLLYPLI